MELLYLKYRYGGEVEAHDLKISIFLGPRL